MALFLDLYLGHLLGDFMFQPGRLVIAKRRGAPGLFAHTAIIAVTCTAVLWGQLAEHWLSIVLIVFAHAGIELITIAAYRGTPTRGLFTFLLDQAMHILSIILVVWLTGAWAMPDVARIFGIEMPIGDVVLVVELVAVGFLGSIFAFETANAILLPRGGKNVILKLDVPRILGILERIAALALAVWFAPWALPIPFLPRFVGTWFMPEDVRARRRVELVSGLVLCALAYALLLGAEAATSMVILPS